ncbi:MAG: site-2 protease family protein [Coriobacteriia bacterium]|nr:site-2 protease family protein [Coriobacteriia bacterium]
MFRAPSLRLGRLFGIPIEVNITWLIVFVLVASTLSLSYYPAAFPDRPVFVDVASGVITALLFFVSIVFHEMSHSLVARAGGIRVEKVTLFVFGGVAEMRDEPTTPGREFVMAIAGPAASILLAAAFGLAAVVMHAWGVSNVWWAPFEYLAIINLSVALFNMLPGFPLDGGRVLRSILWKATGSQLTATRWASGSGQVIGYSLIAIAVFGVLRGNLNLIWIGLVGWFISMLADSSYRQQAVREALHGFSVGDVATREVDFVTGDISVERLVLDHFVAGPHTRYPVVVDGQIVGLVTLDDAKRVGRAEWATTVVADIATTTLKDLVVEEGDSADRLLDHFSRPEAPGALIVRRDGRLGGIVTRSDVTARLRRHGRESEGS